RLQASRAFSYRVASALDQGRGRAARKDAAACLLFSSENAVQVALEAIQCLGGNGYINEFPAGRLLRDAKLYDIGAGTNEIRRMMIGRELFQESVDKHATGENQITGEISMAESIVIVGAKRTPIGAMQGKFNSVSASELGASAIKAAVEQ